MNKINQQIRYVKRYKDQIRIIILDAGVEIFRNSNIKDYPEGGKGRIDKIVAIYWRLKNITKKVEIWPVIADYPDDYTPHQLWINNEITNIERTIENIIYATDYYKEIPWLIPIQGHFKKPKSITRTLTILEELGIIQKYQKFAIANLCTESDSNILYTSIKLARDFLGHKKWIHVFGPKLKSLHKIKHIIDSFDSTSWTRPVSPILGNWSCKNQFERVLFFTSWYLRYLEIVKN